jgi:hypothetical protein
MIFLNVSKKNIEYICPCPSLNKQEHVLGNVLIKMVMKSVNILISIFMNMYPVVTSGIHKWDQVPLIRRTTTGGGGGREVTAVCGGCIIIQHALRTGCK